MKYFVGLTAAVILLACGFSVSASTVASKGDSRAYQIIFSTFDRSSAGQYSYLRDSIQGMIISRLAVKDRVKVIDKVLSESELSKLKKKKNFTSLKVNDGDIDYIVTGDLFGVTKGLNIKVTLYPLDTEGEILNYSILSESPENIIGDIGLLTEKIAQGAFGYSAKTLTTEKLATSEAGDRGFTTVHPEAAYKKGLYTGSVSGSAIGGFEVEAIGVKRKLSIDGEVLAMAVGDVDGDLEQEIFILQGIRLAVYRVDGRAIVKLSEKRLKRGSRIHALNLADINGDGNQEIYLSGTDGLSVSSTIMAWNKDTGFSYLAQHIPLYLRPLFIPKKGIRLAGQSRGVEKIELVKPGVQLYTLNAAFRPEVSENLPIPRSVNLFDFSYGDLDGDGYYELIVVDQNENLKVYSPSNELMWISDEKFGGSKTYLGPSQGGAANEQDRRNFTVDEDSERELIFVPGRITVVDINGDGKDEVLVNENKMSTLGFFRRVRPYTSGTIIGMVWSDDALLEAWKTGSYRGYLVDYSFIGGKAAPDVVSGSFTKRQSRFLYVANIPSSGSLASMLPGSSDTELSVYELGFSSKKTER